MCKGNKLRKCQGTLSRGKFACSLGRNPLSYPQLKKSWMIRPSCAVAKLPAAVASSTVCPVAWATAATSSPKAFTHSARNRTHTSKTQQ